MTAAERRPSRLLYCPPGPLRQTLLPGRDARHRHGAGYAAIVLPGRYRESGDPGRWQVGDRSRKHGLAPATVSRKFSHHFGVTPLRYGIAARARSAWLRIVTSGDSLAGIATDYGFANQAHPCRTVLQMTGDTPGAWRLVKFTGAGAG